MTSARDWNIGAPAHHCYATGKKFTDGEKLISVLEETPREWVRRDYSQEGWQQTAHSEGEVASRWHSEYRAKPVVQEAVPQNDVESLLRRLIHAGNAEDTPARYVLAVMLERKKRLKAVDTMERGERRILIYEHAKTGESFLIEDPRLKLSELEPVQERVRALLENPGTIRSQSPVEKPAFGSGWWRWRKRQWPAKKLSAGRLPARGRAADRTRGVLISR